jgi:hypothetical protein
MTKIVEVTIADVDGVILDQLKIEIDPGQTEAELSNWIRDALELKFSVVDEDFV